jgi:hypothetical protein
LSSASAISRPNSIGLFVGHTKARKSLHALNEQFKYEERQRVGTDSNTNSKLENQEMWGRSSERELKQRLKSAYRHIDWLHKKNLPSAKAETAICHLQGEVYVLRWKLRDAIGLLSRVRYSIDGTSFAKEIDAFLAQPGNAPPVVPGGLAGYEDEQQMIEPRDEPGG